MSKRPRSDLAVVILAAGKGERMRSDRPKVMFDLAGWPLVRHVVEAARRLKPGRLVAVVGHGRREVETALDAGAEIVGINNRDLETFRTDLATTARLRKLLGDDKTVVSESGISSRDDVELLENVGVNAVLVGDKVRELLGDTS